MSTLPFTLQELSFRKEVVCEVPFEEGRPEGRARPWPAGPWAPRGEEGSRTRGGRAEQGALGTLLLFGPASTLGRRGASCVPAKTTIVSGVIVGWLLGDRKSPLGPKARPCTLPSSACPCHFRSRARPDGFGLAFAGSVCDGGRSVSRASVFLSSFSWARIDFTVPPQTQC